MILACNNISKSFGIDEIIKNASFHIEEREKAAIVGINGAGKTTLLRIIMGEYQADSGEVVIAKDRTIGYLAQHQNLTGDNTIYDELLSVKKDIIELEQKIRRLELEMHSKEGAELEAVMEAYSKSTHQFELQNGYAYKSEVTGVLKGLGFEEADFDKRMNTLSGGQKTRVALGRLLLSKPDIIMLDEPTNHLDIESIQWLEQFLAQSAKAVVLVSHDRAFINNVTNRTLEITCGRVEDYKVKYDEYVVLRAERREQQLRAYENQQKEIADIKDFIERFRYKPTKAVQVQSRIKQLEKIVPIEVDEVDNKQMHLKFPPCLRSGDYPIICDEVRKDYGAHTVFDHVTFTIKRGEKVAFVGKNGEGKSTLVKCIMGEIPFTGTLKIGHNVQIGYFAQNQAQLLDENLTIFQTIDNVATGEMRLKVNDLLGAFMFGGETSEKFVKVLSGGERSRLAMIKLLLEPVNLLILDEPTNHLDMQSKDVLKEAIKAFDGTAIIVSHDREFLDGLVDKVYEFGGGKVREHLGGIYDYLRAHNAENINQALANQSMVSAGSPSANTSGSSVASGSTADSLASATSGKQSYAEHKEQQKKIRKAEKAVKECEAKIEKLEARKKEIDELLMKPENATNMELVTEYTELMKGLDEENERWMLLSEELEEVSK